MNSSVQAYHFGDFVEETATSSDHILQVQHLLLSLPLQSSPVNYDGLHTQTVETSTSPLWFFTKLQVLILNTKTDIKQLDCPHWVFLNIWQCKIAQLEDRPLLINGYTYI